MRRSRRTALLALAASVGLFAGVLATSAPAGSATPAWSIVASPNPAGATQNEFDSVSCVSATNCVAVGFSANAKLEKTLVERWNGTSWSIVPSPNPPHSTFNELHGVSCASATNCLAVGQRSSGALVERWNGTSWSIVASPPGDLLSVSCTRATNCIAVGGYYPKTLTERWNGKTMSIIASPNPAHAAYSYLDGVSCTSATSCVAVGQSTATKPSGNKELPFKTLVERWNGRSWSIVASPNPAGATSSLLYGISCVSATNCIAVGGYTSTKPVSPAYLLGALMEHWNGTSWSIVETFPFLDHSWLNSVSCTSATSCVAVGPAFQETLWDGSSVSFVPGQYPTGVNGAALTSVSCATATNCLAVGFQDINPRSATLAEQYA